MKEQIVENKSENQELSLKGYRWEKKEFCDELKGQIIDKLKVSDVVAEIVSGRAKDLPEAENFLNTTLKNNIKDPFMLKDMRKGVELVTSAIKENKKIVIFADYDVDGATSAAIFRNYFREIGQEIEVYVPDRITEGYGPNSKALLELKEQNTDLVITVDCGTTAFEPLEVAHKAGLDVIVIDHHLGTSEIPKALAIINPNRADESSEYGYLCAAGVSFLFLVALNNILEKDGFFESTNKPNLLTLLDLVAIGTVCDMVPLKELNRAIVKQGLKILAHTNRVGVKALSEISNCDFSEADSYHLGFVIGPRINAGGRVATSNLGADLLSSASYDEARDIALKLELHNKERKAIETSVQEKVIKQIEEQQLYNNSVIIVSGENWHPGVIGIVASRVKEKYDLPAIVISFENQIGKASCRSIKGVDLGSAIVDANDNNLLVNGGGHAMAAGFTIEKDKLEEFSNYLNNALEIGVKAANSNKVKQYHYNTSISAFSLEFIKEINLIAPYGQENLEPKFVIDDCRVFNIKKIGVNHLKLRLVESVDGVYGKSLDAVMWKALDTEIGSSLFELQGKKISVLGMIKINKWNDKEIPQFQIEDVKYS